MVTSSSPESSPQVQLPRTFSVGITAPNVSGGGQLHVAKGTLICQLGGFTKRLAGVERVRHNSNTVDVFRARLIPFWFNVSTLISDGKTVVRASLWSFGFRSLVDTLGAAGFSVQVHRTWFFRGYPDFVHIPRTTGD
jgi:hypothetical protein